MFDVGCWMLNSGFSIFAQRPGRGGVLGLHLDQVPILSQLIQKDDDHALQVALLVAEEPDEQRQSQQHQPQPWQPRPEETADEQFNPAQRPETDPGAQAQRARSRQRMSCLARGCSSATVVSCSWLQRVSLDLHVVIAPADVGFVRPAVLVQPAQNIGHQSQPVEALLGPVLHLAQGLLAVAQREGIQRLAAPPARWARRSRRPR